MSSSRRTTRATGTVPLVSAAESGKSAEALAERRAPASDRPSLRDDLAIRRQVQIGQVTWIVKNPEAMKYYYFDDSEWGLIELFDGTRTLDDILGDYRRLFPQADTQMSLIVEYQDLLKQLDLLRQASAEKSLALLQKMKTARQRAADEKAEGFNPFFMPFHVVNPDRFLNRTVRYVRWIWRPPMVALWLVLAAWTVAVFVRNWGPIFTGTYELYAFLRKPLLDAIQFFLLLSIIGGIHELGHAYATKIYGGEVRDIGIALLYFTPAFYCDTTDSLLFESKWQRLWVTTAGIYIEGFICSGATALWVLSYPDSFLHDFAYKTMLFTGISTIFFNINPLVKIDGYYALTSILGISELREESFRYIGASFQNYVLRLPVEVPASSRRKRRIYWIYGVLALAYTAVIMRFIGGIFYNLYSKYFPDFAVVLLLLTLYRIFRKRVRLVTRTARLLYLDKKEWLMSPKARQALAVGAVGLAAVLLVPWGRRTISSESVLRPAESVRIEAPEDGIVADVRSREGDTAAANSELIRMASLDSTTNIAHFGAIRQRLMKSAGTARQQSQADILYAAERGADAATVSLEGEQSRAERLSVRSPISGVVLTPRVQDLIGRFVRGGTVLAEVGDCSRMAADLTVSERLVGDIRVGSPVNAFVAESPLRPLHGVIVRISPATANQPETVRGSSSPPPPVAQPDRFIAVALFDNPGLQLRPGSPVQAKIYSDRASYAARAWRGLRRWLETVLW